MEDHIPEEASARGLRRIPPEELAAHLLYLHGVVSAGSEFDPESVSEEVRTRIKDMAHDLHSTDPSVRAAATRAALALAERASKQVFGEDPIADGPDEHFRRQPLSVEETRSSFVGVLNSLPGETADRMRSRLGLAPPSEGANDQEGSQARVAFSPEEASVAAMLATICIAFCDVMTKRRLDGYYINADMLLTNTDIRRDIEVAVLTDDTLVSGDESRRKELVARVYVKVLARMRQSFESQQAMLRQLRLDADQPVSTDS